MNAKYKQLIDSIKRGEGDEPSQHAAAGVAIDELMQEAKEIHDLLQELQPLRLGLSRGGYLPKMRAAYYASNHGAPRVEVSDAAKGGA
jgi:hypothetical protein